MERATYKTKLSPSAKWRIGRETKRLATTEQPDIVGIPLIVGVVIIRVEIQTIIVVFDIEDVKVVVRIGSVQNAAYITTS